MHGDVKSVAQSVCLLSPGGLRIDDDDDELELRTRIIMTMVMMMMVKTRMRMKKIMMTRRTTCSIQSAVRYVM